MSNADEYIQKFKELESVVKDSFGLNDWDSVTNFLSKRDEYRPFREEIKYCQEVRNLLQHKQKIGGKYPIEPSKEMIAFLERTIDSIKNRKTCGEIMIPMDRLLYRRKSDSVHGTLQKMRKMSTGHVPIIGENGTVIGVFTAVSFLNFIADRKGEPFDSKLSFSDIEKYTSLYHHESEVYRYVKASLYVDELRDVFEQTYSGGKRLAMVFVTSNGEANGKLLGTVSPWDILAKENAE